MPIKTKIFLISNMYPSLKNVRYGIFVKNFENAIKEDFSIEKIVLTKTFGILKKAIGYFVLYFKILTLFFAVKSKDIVYVHFPLHVAPILLLLSLKHKKIILNFHGSDLIFESKLTKLLSLFLLPLIRYSYTVVPSNYFKEKLTNEFNVPISKVFVYPSGGINRKVFFKMERIKNKTFTIGYISNFIKEKGWLLLLEAIKTIERQNLIKNLKVIMIGDGPDKNEIENITSTLKTEVAILSNVEQKKLVNYYNLFDVFVFPTYREAESLGLVGLEAMACGIPVIAGKIGGPMGYVENGFNGYLFPPKNSEELTNQILAFFRLNDVERSNMSQNCIKTASNYDSLKVNQDLIQYLKSFN
ncbi:MAG: glycosyltransferase family 4 protein [Arenibacter sp.]